MVGAAGPDADPDADPEPTELPLGSVLGALDADAPGVAELAELADTLEPGASYRVPATA